jgi:hypothetical protein
MPSLVRTYGLFQPTSTGLNCIKPQVNGPDGTPSGAAVSGELFVLLGADPDRLVRLPTNPLAGVASGDSHSARPRVVDRVRQLQAEQPTSANTRHISPPLPMYSSGVEEGA